MARIKSAAQFFTINIVLSLAFNLKTYTHQPVSAAHPIFWECLVQAAVATFILVLLLDWVRGVKERCEHQQTVSSKAILLRKGLPSGTAATESKSALPGASANRRDF